MRDIINHRIVVKDSEKMEWDEKSNTPICPECEISFIECDCPKPWSTIDSDGYEIVLEKGELVAYPSPELYVGLSLWIFRNNDHLICGHCLQWIKVEWDWTEEITLQVVEEFFSIHCSCRQSDREQLFINGPHHL